MTLKELFANDRFAVGTGCEIIEAGDGHSLVRMKVEERHLNAGGTCQGGAIFTLADYAFALCVNSHGLLTVSLNGYISFTSSPKAGDTLIAEGREVVNHHKIPYCEVRITNQDDQLVAVFSGQSYRKNVELPIEP